MAEIQKRKYPIGLQTFTRIIREGYLYIDKTDLIWELAHYTTFIFLSRPRRFGKSLLTSTLESYFKGERELFEGLKIMELEKEWQAYPVIRLDLSGAKYLSPALTRKELERIIEPYESLYGMNASEATPGMRLAGVVQRAFEKTGKQVAIIFDEYDAPLLDVLHEGEVLKEMREVMQEFFQRLKMLEPYIKFCFLTGITKFSQLSIFSTINNLTNVTLDRKFANICGITDQELTTVLHDDIAILAKENHLSFEDMHQKLKGQYDGYHFSENSDGLYNPFSLLKAFQQGKVSDYWFESGTPTFLIRQMQHFQTDITSIDHLEVPSSAFDQPSENMQDALPLLYQSGYLTIKDYDQESQIYTLGIPNQEVRIGYAQGLLPFYTGLNSAGVQTGFALKFWRALKANDIEQALREMQSYLSSIPYVEGFKKKLEDVTSYEGFYEYTLYLIFSMLNIYARTQVKCSQGRTDLVVFMPDAIYVMELKVNDTAQKALEQINAKGYATPYLTDGRKVLKVGISFNIETRTIEEWLVE